MDHAARAIIPTKFDWPGRLKPRKMHESRLKPTVTANSRNVEALSTVCRRLGQQTVERDEERLRRTGIVPGHVIATSQLDLVREEFASDDVDDGSGVGGR